MIELQRVTRAGDPLLGKLLPLYEEAFPPPERRDAGQLKRVIERASDMYFNAIVEDGTLAGLFAYWDLGEFCYLEHLAVFPSLRSRSTGTRVLEEVARRLPGTRLLEVEPPVEPPATRRVAYYERNGYLVLDRAYVQPPYDGKRAGCPLWIIGNERPACLARFLERVKTRVYRENENV